MKMKLSFRSANQADIEFLLELRKKTMSTHLTDAGINQSDQYHLARIKEHFTDSNIILCNGISAGLLKLGRKPHSLHIRQFQILPEFQGNGLGSQILQIDKRKSAEIELPLTLSVLLKNPAKFLYLRHGFNVVDENSLEYRMECSLQESKKG